MILYSEIIATLSSYFFMVADILYKMCNRIVLMVNAAKHAEAIIPGGVLLIQLCCNFI